MQPPHFGLPRLRRRFRLQIFLCTIAALHCQAAVAPKSGAKHSFNVPAQAAESALKVFSEQSGKGVIMNANTVDGIRTNRLIGAFTPLEALQQLLAGTGLVATRDEKSEAFVVHREVKPPSNSMPPSATGGGTPKGIESPESPNLEPVKTNKLFGGLSVVFSLLGAPVADAAEGAGAIAGRVSSVSTGTFLEKARIRVDGTALETFTDEAGYYRLAPVPSGTARVRAFFTGLVAHASGVTVSAGQTVQHDIGLEVYRGRGAQRAGRL